MSRLLNVLAPRMRRASLVLLLAGIVMGVSALSVLALGFVSTNQAAGLLTLCFVLLISGAILFALSWFGQGRR
jgi:hypothetical protein